MRGKLRANVWLGVLVMVALLGVAAGHAHALDQVTLNTNWAPVGDHAPYYVAKKLGFYERAGLDVDIVRGQGSADAVTRVDAGLAEFGIADAPTVIIARAQGAWVKMVGMVFDLSPFTM